MRLTQVRDVLMRDVVDAVAEHEADGPVAGGEQRPEVLAGEIARERPSVRRAMQLALRMLDRRADRDELGELSAPLVPPDLEANADDAVGAERVGLLLHARHRELARVVHRLRQHVELLVLAPAPELQADVVDRAADDEAERLEAGLLDEQELVHRQVAREEAARLAHAAQPLATGLRDSFERCRVVAHALPRPSAYLA